MRAGLILIGFSDPDVASILDQIGVAHAHVGIVEVEKDFGLRPFDDLAFGAIDFDATAEPDGIAIFIPRAAVVVEPVEVVSIFQAPREVGRARVFH